MKKIITTLLLSGLLIAPVSMQAAMPKFTPLFGVKALVPLCEHFGISVGTDGKIGIQANDPKLQNLISITAFAIVMGYVIYNKNKLIKPEFGVRISPNA